MVKKYALVRNGKIKKLRNVPDDDTLITKKMLAHGYLPVNEEAVPIFDGITQSLLDTYEISTDKVTRKWTVTERNFDDAKRIKKEEIKTRALDHINIAFDSHNEASVVSDILTMKKNFMMTLNAAKNNNDLRNIDVVYNT